MKSKGFCRRLYEKWWLFRSRLNSRVVILQNLYYYNYRWNVSPKSDIIANWLRSNVCSIAWHLQFFLKGHVFLHWSHIYKHIAKKFLLQYCCMQPILDNAHISHKVFLQGHTASSYYGLFWIVWKNSRLFSATLSYLVFFGRHQEKIVQKWKVNNKKLQRSA